MTWLRLIHADFPALVKQRAIVVKQRAIVVKQRAIVVKQHYGIELRLQTLASLKPEIYQALDTLLDEIHASNETKVLRTAFRRLPPNRDRIDLPKSTKDKGDTTKSFPLCKQRIDRTLNTT